MQTKIVHVTQDANGASNHGKFLVGRFDEAEVHERDPFSGFAFWSPRWGKHHHLVLDVETGEGAIFALGGMASYDLNTNHQIWVCPMFEPFLEWLYAFHLARCDSKGWELDHLPRVVELPDAEFAMAGYRRTRGANVKKETEQAKRSGQKRRTEAVSRRQRQVRQQGGGSQGKSRG